MSIRVSAVRVPATRRRALRSSQFGLRHVLLLTTSLALFLGVLRAFDLLSPDRLLNLGSAWLGWASLGLMLPLVIVVAAWGTLGEGPAWLRGCLFGTVCGSSGVALILLEVIFGESSSRTHFRMHTNLWHQGQMALESHATWIAWCLLAGGLFLAAFLLVHGLKHRVGTFSAPLATRRANRLIATASSRR